MRIVESDNYDGDYPDETFLNIPNLPSFEAKAIAELINACFPTSHPRYWKVVPDNYVLRPGYEL